LLTRNRVSHPIVSPTGRTARAHGMPDGEKGFNDFDWPRALERKTYFDPLDHLCVCALRRDQTRNHQCRVSVPVVKLRSEN